MRNGLRFSILLAKNSSPLGRTPLDPRSQGPTEKPEGAAASDDSFTLGTSDPNDGTRSGACFGVMPYSLAVQSTLINLVEIPGERDGLCRTRYTLSQLLSTLHA